MVLAMAQPLVVETDEVMDVLRDDHATLVDGERAEKTIAHATESKLLLYSEDIVIAVSELLRHPWIDVLVEEQPHPADCAPRALIRRSASSSLRLIHESISSTYRR